MKQIALKLIALGVLTCMAGLGLVLYNSGRVGKITDTYRGVVVHDNGLLYFRSYGKNFSKDGYYFGQKWQCVEFIKRFYFEAKGHEMPDVMGHAKSYFHEDVADGAVNARRGLVQYRNGSTNKPALDDLLVFTNTKYGHVGIVTAVADNSLEIIQQNILNKPRQRFELVTSNGHYFVTSPRQPAGWLRKK